MPVLLSLEVTKRQDLSGSITIPWDDSHLHGLSRGRLLSYALYMYYITLGGSPLLSCVPSIPTSACVPLPSGLS